MIHSFKPLLKSTAYKPSSHRKERLSFEARDIPKPMAGSHDSGKPNTHCESLSMTDES